MSTYKLLFPDLLQSERSAQAKIDEESIFKLSTSKDEYQRLLQAHLEKLKNFSSQPSASAPGTPTTGHAKEPEDSDFKEQIGPYRGIHHASGIFSAIYRSRDPNSGAAIAIKVATPDLLVAPHNVYKEARLLRVAASQHVVPLISSQTVAGGRFLLIFPFIPFDLGGLIDRGTLTHHQSQSHLRDLFSALVHIHSLGIVHRDIKPSNLLLQSPEGPAYLADFGIAWQADYSDAEPMDQKITDVGTTCYRPPELLFGCTSYGSKLDTWAAGCVVAETLRKGSRSLFDAGNLGSELALIRSIFETLGTPNNETWPVRGSPTYGQPRC